MILRRGALGDVVLVGAIASGLPRPVLVCTQPRYHPVVKRMIGVDGALDWGAAPPPDHHVVDLQRTTWASRLRKHSVARRLRLWGIGRGRPAVTALYGRAAGVEPRRPPWITVPTASRDALVVLPGASTPLKQPPPRLLDRVVAGWSGPVLAVGGPHDRAALAALAPAPHLAMVHDASGFEGTLAAFAQARVAVGGDTGLSHLAAACGVPTVVIAGPTHPDDGFLSDHFAQVVDRQLFCRPCTLHRRRRCWRGHQSCFDLDPDDLIDAVRSCAG